MDNPLHPMLSPWQQVIPTASAVSLEDDGDYARFENRGDEDLDFMLIEAEPTRESVVARVRQRTDRITYTTVLFV